MKISIGENNGKAVAFDMDTLLTTRLLIQANSGAGKSWLLRKLIEQLYGHVQVIVIDPEGEFATLRKKFDFVLVGAGGETAADVRSAEMLAEKLLELRASAVCDLYEMKPKDRHIWVERFLNSMVNAPKKLWHSCVVIVDEAQLFCPQDGESVASEAMVSLTTRGRKRGFCAVWATQRLAKVNKDATAMLLNRLVGGTFEDVDIKRALDLLSVPPEEKRAVAQQLKTMDPGWFFAFGRAIAKTRLLFKVGMVETPHPQAGSAKHAADPPPATEKIRDLLPQLADLPQAAEEKARSIAELQRELRELKAKLVAAERAKLIVDPEAMKAAAAKAVMDAIAKRDKAWQDEFRVYLAGLMGVIDRHKQSLRDELISMRETRFPSLDKPIKAHVESAASQAFQRTPAPHVPSAKVLQSANPALKIEAASSNGAVSNPQRRILGAVAQFEAIGRPSVPKKWIAALAGVRHSSGSFANNLGALRSAGYIAYPESGVVALTDDGRAHSPAIEAPRDSIELHDRCKEILSNPQSAILDIVLSSYPNAISKSDVAETVGVSPSSGSFANNLGAMRSAGMIDYPEPGKVRAADWLFLENA